MEKQEARIKMQIKRLQAIDLAHTITRLTEENIFEAAYNALKEGDKATFINLCGKVGVPPAVAEQLWQCWLEILEAGTPGWVS